MNRFIRTAALLGAVAAFSGRANAESLKVDADKGNSTLSAVFDAPLGERIMAVSNAVGCDLTWDDKGMTMSGTCSVPLTAIRVDNDDTKSDHFRQWATNKKGKEKTCKLSAKFTGIKPDKALVAEQPVSFSGDVPFTICDRAREDGKPEHVTGTVVLLPGDKKILRIRAHVDQFDREAYHVGPKWTDGWLARVQGLAKVVAAQGAIDLNLFAAANEPAK
ncbi:MAG: hypothetical protein JST54_03015 [Deltaproteobacteria bacterium]|nr:hypothetical protein [Deltaproteobacteria bacterium]